MPEQDSKDANETARNLIRQLDKFVDGHPASGDAFVASVYGEWGVGKTHCLKSVAEHYERVLTEVLTPGRAHPKRLVLPVMFVPWRYEHEEHLVVPMLKTIEHALTALQKRVEAFKTADDSSLTKQFVDGTSKLLVDGAKTVAGLARATASSVKFKFAPLGVGVEVDGKTALAEGQSTQSDAAAKAEAELSSLYFDAEQRLAKITAEQESDAGFFALRVVVLVDDLDRCLPEKAVQVLESVKLFLNVSGFSFVLAVDDEVVERGIAHRYREYRLADKDGAFTGDLPISGTQYLEKIVHLPVHLPRWTRSKAEAFLLSRYPQLYERRAEADRAKPDALPADVGATAPAANDVLKLLLDATPLVPRKLIRLSEGMDYLQSQLRELGHADKWAPLHALRVVALQQLHPVLYRHVRQRSSRYPRLFEIDRDAWHEPRYKTSGEVLQGLRQAFEDRGKASAGSTQTPQDSAQADTQKEKLDLLDRLHHCASQRGAGHPLDFFAGSAEAGLPANMNWEHFLQLYFHHEALPAPPVTPPPGHHLPTAAIADAAAAVNALLNPDRVSRQEFIESQQLDGKQLPAAVLDGLLARLGTATNRKALVLDLDWLRDLSNVTSPEQLLRLYDRGQVLRSWQEATTP